MMKSTIIAVVLISVACSSNEGVEDVGELCDKLASTYCDAAKDCGLVIPGEGETEAQIINECLISSRNTCSRELSSLDELASPAACSSDLKNNSCTEIQDGLAAHIRSCDPAVSSDVDGGVGPTDGGVVLSPDAGNQLDDWCLQFGMNFCSTVEICPGISPTPDCAYNTYLECLSNGAPNNEQLCDSGIRDWEILCPLLESDQWPAACW